MKGLLATFGSAMTKSGLYKDERDTVVRRRRHRDRKLLLGGLGLTTGLVWSDRCVVSFLFVIYILTTQLLQ